MQMPIRTQLRLAQSTFTQRNGKKELVAQCFPRRSTKFESASLTKSRCRVLEANQRARSFYESFGFVQDGAMKDDDHWKGFAIREVRYRLNLADGLTRRFRP